MSTTEGAHPPDSTESDEQATDSPARILLIDDNEAIHRDFRRVLGPRRSNTERFDALEAQLFGSAPPRKSVRRRFDIDSAMQGDEGLRLVQKALEEGRPYAMAFIDVRMPPGWDGIETTQRIWEVQPDLEVVICTAYADYTWSEMIETLGHTDRLLILKKPFDKVEVTQLAHALSEKSSLRKQALATEVTLRQMVEEQTRELRALNERLKSEVAERERIEVELRHKQKLEAVGQLAAGIAHELNTPIQFIGDSLYFIRDGLNDYRELLEFARTLAQEHGPEERVKELGEMEEDIGLDYLTEELPVAFETTFDGVHRIAEIVRSMKEFAHPGREKSAADLNRAIQNTLTISRNEVRYVADTEVDLGDIPPVVCHLDHINQVILNLVVNAAHAISDKIEGTNDRGLIKVATSKHGGHVQIAVSDTGTGIPEDVQERIFDPFFTTKDVGRGTGQGLAMARSIVEEKHGGSLTFETAAGEGTTFFMKLPIDGANGEP